MRSDLTDITVVLDRSGSMESCRVEAEGGLNSFVREQREKPGDALFTLVQFDTEYEFVHKAVPIRDVPDCKLVPRGWTALLDAVGRAIIETGERLASVSEDQRPGLVAFVIITDGEENSSKEYTNAKIKQMIEHQQTAYKWQFTFLGANQDAFAEAAKYGITSQDAAQFTSGKVDLAFAAASSKMGRMRHQASTGQSVSSAYTDQERKAMS